MTGWSSQPEVAGVGRSAGVPIPARVVEVRVPTEGAGTQGAVDLAPPGLTCATPPAAAGRGVSAALAAVMELGKPRITRLVALTALGGAALGLVGKPWTPGAAWVMLGGVAIGTALSSAGANALNQCIERGRDALMHRTRHRPLPSRRLSLSAAAWAGAAMLGTGLAVLWLLCGPAAAVISALAALVYVAVYTPMKPRSVLNTWVGTIPGALPPLIGWAAAAEAVSVAAGGGSPAAAGFRSLLDGGGWSLFTLMAVWQIPHFLALAWVYREDYARGGYRMLPVVDPTGRATVTQIVIWAALLVPASLSPWLAMPGRVGLLYGVIAGVSGVWYLIEAARLVGDRSPARARRVFLFSVMHLPLLVGALTASCLWPEAWVPALLRGTP